MPKLDLTPEFQKRVIAIAGEPRGRAWLSALPSLVDDLSVRWDLDDLSVLSNSYHLVALTKSAVLKICAPQGDADREYEALIAFQGPGFVRLLAHDDAHQALLMERIEPGATLAEMEDDERATEIAADVFKAVHRPAEGPFPDIHRWGAALFDVSLPSPLLEEVRALWRELTASSEEPVLCHGDLHQFNILDGGERGWVAIDPKGVFAEPAFETGAFLRNLTERDQKRRIAIFAKRLGHDEERIRKWAFAQAVLSACWCVQDGDDWEGAVRNAEQFRTA